LEYVLSKNHTCPSIFGCFPFTTPTFLLAPTFSFTLLFPPPLASTPLALALLSVKTPCMYLDAIVVFSSLITIFHLGLSVRK
jgi:hypothetical protein